MRARLKERILRVLHDGGSWDQLALDIHHYQHAHDPVVRALTSKPPTHIREIPAIPVGLFRDLEVGTIRSTVPHVAFHTSGTTHGSPGIRRCLDTELYDTGCRINAARWLPVGCSRTFGLMADSPVSSLAHMVRGFAARTGPVRFLVDEDGLHLDALSNLSEPVFVCTTGFALDAWVATSPAPLPEGSSILVTGGFKGRRTELDGAAVVAAAERLAPVVQEYGMTELSSQLWSRPGHPFEPPPWLRVTACDPATGKELPPETLGQLRFLDLCNLDSTLHIETLDAGVVDDEGRVHLHGRLEDARPRGCSLALEDLL